MNPSASININQCFNDKYAYKIALGTAQMGSNYGISNRHGIIMPDEISNIINFAGENKIDTIDTAISYGQSETNLGNNKINSFRVVTKIPAIPNQENNIKSWMMNQIEGSLIRLKVDKLYGVLLHSPLQLLLSMGSQIYEGLNDLKKSGVVSKIGYSIYSPTDLDGIYNHFKPDLIQAPLNIFDRRLVKSGWLNKFKNDGVEFHARSVFLQGLLLMPKSKRPKKFNRWVCLWKRWDDFIGNSGINPMQICLESVFVNNFVDRVVVGVDNHLQLKNIIQSRIINFDESLLNKFDTDDELLINPQNWVKL